LGIVVVAIGVWLAGKPVGRPARARRANMEAAGR
ncbi:EamA/RhaT family transporter, partial [Pseudomonas sp. MWU13-2625]